jgi:hypothetical protein
MKNNNYYDAFVDSILSLEPKTRNVLLKTASSLSTDSNALVYLWSAYQDLDNPLGVFLAALLDETKLAID